MGLMRCHRQKLAVKRQSREEVARVVGEEKCKINFLINLTGTIEGGKTETFIWERRKTANYATKSNLTLPRRSLPQPDTKPKKPWKVCAWGGWVWIFNSQSFAAKTRTFSLSNWRYTYATRKLNNNQTFMTPLLLHPDFGSQNLDRFTRWVEKQRTEKTLQILSKHTVEEIFNGSWMNFGKSNFSQRGSPVSWLEGKTTMWRVKTTKSSRMWLITFSGFS